ncbi:MAG: hypothetical protein M5U34_38055 [Chloroflexi bacterium]|nr:hypothetical protein [Chloroflexota bacterium]
MRDELYRFLDSTIYDTQKNTKTILSRSLVEQDSIIRWMKRFIAIGNHDRAINIAQSVMQLSPSTFVEGNTNAALKNFPQNDHFFWGHFSHLLR